MTQFASIAESKDGEIMSQENESIPALHQSTQTTMACPEFYVTAKVDGHETPPNIHSDRGTQVHHVMAGYGAYCAQKKVGQDWGAFDQLAAAVGLDAGIILDGLRDNYVVDFEHLYATELLLMLDEDFAPTVTDDKGVVHPEPFPGAIYSEKRAAYASTLDVVNIDGNRAKIDDFKSHFRPFTPDTFQSEMYPFILLQHLAWLEEVEFELIFVRFRNARRSVTYKREDMVDIIRDLERARQRQKQFHILAAEPGRPGIEALPGPHCVYCPKMVDLTCPWRQFNPYTAVDGPERLKFAVWAGKALEANRGPLQDFVTYSETGTISYADDNGNIHTAKMESTESNYYPAVQTLAMLVEWNEACGGDPTLFNGLRISSTQLKPKLKAKKRAILDQRIRGDKEAGIPGIAVKETKTTFKIRTSDGEPVDDGAPKYGEESEF